MIMAGIEKVAFDNGYTRGFDRGRKEAQKKAFNRLIKYLMANESLSKSEAEKKALEALSLEKVPF